VVFFDHIFKNKQTKTKQMLVG